MYLFEIGNEWKMKNTESNDKDSVFLISEIYILSEFI